MKMPGPVPQGRGKARRESIMETLQMIPMKTYEQDMLCWTTLKALWPQGRLDVVQTRGLGNWSWITGRTDPTHVD